MRTNGKRATATIATIVALAPTACWSAPHRAPKVEGPNVPPKIAEVRDGLGPDIDAQQRSTSLYANWDTFVDPEGQSVVYEWSVGTEPGATDVLDWHAVAGARQASASDLQLPTGVSLHVNVRARDASNRFSDVASSDGVVVGRREVRPSSTWRPATPRAQQRFAEIERHGISWTFAEPARCGRYVNGDWWVVGR